jgi:hypothetical protein
MLILFLIACLFIVAPAVIDVYTDITAQEYGDQYDNEV